MVGRSRIWQQKTYRTLRVPARSSHEEPAPPAPSVFDPATLPFSLAIRGAYAGPPWNGIATAGMSASNWLDTVGADPIVGAALNGYATADFNGSQYLHGVIPGPSAMTFADIFSDTAYYFAALVFIRSAAPPAAQDYSNPLIIGDDGGAMGVAVSDQGVMGFHLQSPFLTYAETGWAPLSFNAWHFVEWWYDGANIHIAVDGVEGARVAALSAAVENLEHVRIGADFSGVGIDGRIEEVWCAPTDLSANSANMIAYENARYDLAL